jgi:hypothetical protein
VCVSLPSALPHTVTGLPLPITTAAPTAKEHIALLLLRLMLLLLMLLLLLLLCVSTGHPRDAEGGPRSPPSATEGEGRHGASGCGLHGSTPSDRPTLAVTGAVSTARASTADAWREQAGGKHVEPDACTKQRKQHTRAVSSRLTTTQ